MTAPPEPPENPPTGLSDAVNGYCLRCGGPQPHHCLRPEDTMPDKSFAERLDAATNGDEFGTVIKDLFSVLGKARDDEEREADQ